MLIFNLAIVNSKDSILFVLADGDLSSLLYVRPSNEGSLFLPWEPLEKEARSRKLSPSSGNNKIKVSIKSRNALYGI